MLIQFQILILGIADESPLSTAIRQVMIIILELDLVLK